MKKLNVLLIALWLTASCSKDDDNTTEAVNLCAIPSVAPQNAYDNSKPCSIAVSRSGMIAVGAYNGYGLNAEIKIYTSYQNFSNGIVKSTLTAVSPEAMAFDADNNLYVSETEIVAGIKVYDHIGDGAFAVKKTIQDDFNNPRGLAFDAQGRLFLADDGTGRIIRFDNPFNSDAHVTIGNWDPGIKALAIQGNVMYVANYVTNSVSRNTLKPDGTSGGLTHAIDFDKATDLSFNGTRIVVTSFDSGKLGVFSECNFSDGNGIIYDNLNANFGTAFINNNIVLAATHDANKVTQLLLF